MNQPNYLKYTSILIVLLFFYACDNKDAQFYESKQFINAAQAQTLWKAYNNPLDTTDANNVWFSIKELENYIAYAKTNCSKNRQELTGLRLYFGRYPIDSVKYQMKAGKQTIFFSPTGKLSVKNGQIDPESEERATNDSDLTDLNLLNFGTSGWPPYRIYEPQ